MKIDWRTLAGVITIIFVLSISCRVILSSEFPAFRYEKSSPELIETEIDKIGPETGEFLWNNRLIDLIAQAFVLFAAATCCAAIMRTREKK